MFTNETLGSQADVVKSLSSVKTAQMVAEKARQDRIAQQVRAESEARVASLFSQQVQPLADRIGELTETMGGLEASLVDAGDRLVALEELV